MKLQFFLYPWNIIDVICVILSLISIVYETLVFVITNQQLEELLLIEDNYPHFDHLFLLQLNSDFYLGLTLALHWLKIFNYLTLNRTLLLLNQTMSTCLREIFAFALMFSIILLSYTQLGWLLFGKHLSDWRSFRVSMSVRSLLIESFDFLFLVLISLTLFRMMLGDFDLDALIKIGSIIGPVFLFTYIYFVYFVLLNMFLAIINAAYSKTVTDLSSLQTWTLKGLSLQFWRKKPHNNDDDDDQVNCRHP